MVLHLLGLLSLPTYPQRHTLQEINISYPREVRKIIIFKICRTSGGYVNSLENISFHNEATNHAPTTPAEAKASASKTLAEMPSPKSRPKV